MACLLTKGPVAVILYGWTPDPDEIENPDLSVLEGVVCRQFQKLSAGASSGFDAIPIPFIKSQFGFFPGRSTLHPLFILRHLRHAAKKLKPRNSPRLHVAFIDFSQAYDTVPRQQLWSHLRRMEYSV